MYVDTCIKRDYACLDKRNRGTAAEGVFMALVAQWYYLEVELVDSGANSTKRTYRLTSANIGAAVTDAGTIMTALAAVTDAKVKSYRIGQIFADDALSLPLPGVQIENEAMLTVGIAGHPTKSATLTIPAPKGGVFTSLQGPGSNVVATTATIVTDYVALFNSTGPATLSDGESADPLYGFKGKRVHRKSIRG